MHSLIEKYKSYIMPKAVKWFRAVFTPLTMQEKKPGKISDLPNKHSTVSSPTFNGLVSRALSTQIRASYKYVSSLNCTVCNFQITSHDVVVHDLRTFLRGLFL